jgi:hypothetical protein
MIPPIRRGQLVGWRVQQRLVLSSYSWIHQVKTARSEMHTERDDIEHHGETLTLDGE